MIESKLVQLLESYGLKVYPLRMPETPTLPCVVYQRVSTQQVRTHEAAEMEYPRMQLSCWADKYLQAIQTAQIVKDALDLNRTTFKLAILDGELDLQDEESNRKRRVLEFIIWDDV